MTNTSDKMTKPDTTHAQEIKQQIKMVFLELLKQKTVEQISIREITDAVFLNRTSFYRYFLDVYDVYYQVLDDYIVLFQEQLAILFQKILTNGDLHETDFPFQFFNQNKELLQILLRDPKTLKHLKVQQKVFIKQQLHLNETDRRIDYELEYIISGQIGLVSYWLEHKMEMPVFDLFHLMKRHIMSITEIV